MSFKDYLREMEDQESQIKIRFFTERKKVGDSVYWSLVKNAYNNMKTELQSVNDVHKLFDNAFNEQDPYKAQVWYNEYNNRRGTPGF